MSSETRIHLYPSDRVYDEHPGHVEAAVQGISDVYELQNQTPANIAMADSGKRELIGQLEQQCYSPRQNRLNLNSYERGTLSNLSMRSRQDVVLSDRDLYVGNDNYVFGSTSAREQFSIQSIYRFLRMTDDEQLQLAATRHTARHEYAHMAGLNEPADYQNHDQRGGFYDGHCQNTCTMHQVASSREVLDLVNRLADYEVAGFCNSCVASLRRKTAPGSDVQT